VGFLIGLPCCPGQSPAPADPAHPDNRRAVNVGEKSMQRLRLVYYSLLVFLTAMLVSAIANA
jgi:hypothetical protein